jgi:hypothetical protein
MTKLEQNKNIEFNTRNFAQEMGRVTNLARTALLSVVIFVALTAACKDDKKEEDIVDPPPVLPLPPSPTISVQPLFFGIFLASPTLLPWPATDNFAILRTGASNGVEWKSINPLPDVYDWSKLDLTVQKAQENGKDVLYVLGGSNTPQWASTNQDGTGCAGGPGTCYAPIIAEWQKFLTAVTARYDGNHRHGKIKYWELWNEPDTPNHWGQVDDPYGKMVELARAAYPIIKAADPDNVVVSPSPQGANSYKWLDTYFAAGGDQYADAIAFHSYFFGGEPEQIITLVENVRQVQAKYPALAGKPLWDTEHSFGLETWPFAANDDEQSAWVARHKILSASVGIESSNWYLWDGWAGQPHYGWLYNLNDKIIRKPGIAYNEVHNWLVNADIGTSTITPSSYEGVRQSQLSRPNGYKGLIVWASSQTPSFTKAFTVPAGYIKYRTLDGKTEHTSGGSVLTLTMKPVLLENQ